MLKTRAGDIIGTTPLLRYSDLKARRIVNNRQTLDNWIKNYGFPPGKMLGPNTRTWTEEEIAAFYASRPDGGPQVEGGE